MIARNNVSDLKNNFSGFNLKESDSKSDSKKTGSTNFFDILSETLKSKSDNLKEYSLQPPANNFNTANSIFAAGKNTNSTGEQYGGHDFYNFKAGSFIAASPIITLNSTDNNVNNITGSREYNNANEEKTNETALSGSQQTKTAEEKETVSKDDKTQENEETKETEHFEEVEKYLQEVFGGVIDFRVSVKNEQNKVNENSVKSDPKSDIKISGREQAFLAKLNEYISKAMPDVDLSKLKIEIVSVNVSKKDMPSRAANVKNKNGSFSNALAGEISKNNAQAPIQEKKSHNGDLKNNLKNGSDKNENLKYVLSGENAENKILSNKNNTHVESSKNAKIDRNAVIDQVKNHIADLKQATAAKNGVYSTQIILNPESLGKVSVEVTMQNGEVSAKFTAENAETREILAAASEKLKETLNETGIKVKNIEFSNDSSMFMANRENNSWQQQNNGKDSGAGNSNGGNERSGMDGQKPWMADSMANTSSGRVTDSLLNDQVLNVRI